MVRAVAFYLALCSFAPQAFATADDAHSSTEPAVRGPRNRPPKLASYLTVEPVMSDGNGRTPLLRCERRTTIRVSVEDPDDDPVSFVVHRLPTGATFDAKEGVVTWTPTRAQEGKHEIDFEVSDGSLTVRRTFTLVVIPNRAPVSTGEPVVFLTGRPLPLLDEGPIESSDPQGATIADDRDGDTLSFVVRKGPPGGTIHSTGTTVVFRWAPGEVHVGEHELVVEVSDGELRTTIEKKVIVVSEWERRSYHGWFLLGGGPSSFLAHDDGEFFVGGSFDVTLVAIREDAEDGYRCKTGKRYRDCHASHHRFYAAFEVLDSLRAGERSLFTYGAGYSASFEWYPGRRTLIPHYGIEAGGLVRDGLGHRAQTRPYLGLHLWSSDDLWVNAALGYRIVPAELYALSGPTLALSVVLNPW